MPFVPSCEESERRISGAIASVDDEAYRKTLLTLFAATRRNLNNGAKDPDGQIVLGQLAWFAEVMASDAPDPDRVLIAVKTGYGVRLETWDGRRLPKTPEVSAAMAPFLRQRLHEAAAYGPVLLVAKEPFRRVNHGPEPKKRKPVFRDPAALRTRLEDRKGREMPKPEALRVEPPREPTPADKRRIFREIDDCWDERKQRYTGAATDKTVGEKLNVPWAWVADIRREHFGETARNEEYDKVVGEMLNVAAEIERNVQKCLDLAGAFEKLQARVKEIEERCAKL